MFKDAENRGLDFHAYWFAGHFVWQGLSPYPPIAAVNPLVLEGSRLTLPIVYWDGAAVQTGEVGQTGFPTVPGLTAPAVLLISVLSRFSWPVAVQLWTALNCLLLIVIVWACTKLLDRPSVSYESLLLLFIAFSLIATRETLEFGQSTIFVLALMLVGLVLADKNQMFGGLVLGIGLSKATLIFPGLLILLYKRQYWGALAAIGMQIVGTGLLALLAHTSFTEIVAAYFRLLSVHAGMAGMHLGQGLLRNQAGLQMGFVLLAASLVAAALIRLAHRREGRPVSPASVAFVLLVIGMLMGLLSFYHRRYDFVAGLLFLALLIVPGSQLADYFVLSDRQREVLWAAVAMVVGVWVFPIYLLTSPALYIYIFQSATLAALAISFWLLFRVRWNPIHGNSIQKGEE
ncbi:MAG: glycosyltransferase 87 family protein [Caldilineaceae bacterium]